MIKLCINEDSYKRHSISLNDDFGMIGVCPITSMDDSDVCVSWWPMPPYQLRKISKIFSDAADECDKKAPSELSSSQLLNKIHEKNRLLEIAHQRFEMAQKMTDRLTAEISKLRIKYYEGKE